MAQPYAAPDQTEYEFRRSNFGTSPRPVPRKSTESSGRRKRLSGGAGDKAAPWQVTSNNLPALPPAALRQGSRSPGSLEARGRSVEPSLQTRLAEVQAVSAEVSVVAKHLEQVVNTLVSEHTTSPLSPRLCRQAQAILQTPIQTPLQSQQLRADLGQDSRQTQSQWAVARGASPSASVNVPDSVKPSRRGSLETNSDPESEKPLAGAPGLWQAAAAEEMPHVRACVATSFLGSGGPEVKHASGGSKSGGADSNLPMLEAEATANTMNSAPQAEDVVEKAGSNPASSDVVAAIVPQARDFEALGDSEEPEINQSISFESHDVVNDESRQLEIEVELEDLRVCSIGYLFECLDMHKRGKLTPEDMRELFKMHPQAKERYPHCEDTWKDPQAFIESVTRILRGVPRKEFSPADVQAMIRTPDLDRSFGEFAEDVMYVCEVFKAAVVKAQASQVADITHVRRSFITATRSADIAHLVAQAHTDRRMRFVESAKSWDPIVLLAIVLNAICIGISLDVSPKWIGWDIIEWIFTAFFVLELSVKCMSSGCQDYFCGKDWSWNLFDFSIVLMAVFDTVATIFSGDYLGITSADESLRFLHISLLRIARLARVSRLLRILRLQALKELTLMINGLILGLKTIFWAIVLLTVVCYAIGLLVRQTIGTSEIDQRELFNNVPQAMFTVYRCCVGECIDVDGSPLAVKLHEEFGWPIMLGYVAIFMFVSFGLFNLILAVFVEKTLALAKLSDRRRHEGIVAEKVRVARMINNVVKKLLLKTNEEAAFRRGSTNMLRSISGFLRLDGPTKDERFSRAAKLQTKVRREIFEAALEDEELLDMFEDLDISVDGKSKFKLFDALDANGDGVLQVSELVEGLMRLRGPADKIDAMSAAIGVRQIQESLRTLQHFVVSSMGRVSQQLGEPSSPGSPASRKEDLLRKGSNFQSNLNLMAAPYASNPSVAGSIREEGRSL